MHTFTVFCQEKDANDTTIWVSSVQTDEWDVEEAKQRGVEACSNDWNCSPSSIHVLGVAVGDVKICYWEDQIS